MDMRFGTDGIRGLVHEEITPKLAYDVGFAVAKTAPLVADEQVSVVVGFDPRPSSVELSDAAARGVAAAGGMAIECGMLPTPAIALAVRQLQASAGIVVTASHNPAEYNGLKVFGRDGRKLRDAQQLVLEKQLGVGHMENLRYTPGSRIENSFADKYVAACVVRSVRLDGLEIVVDCANGAMSDVAPRIFEELGATVHVINNSDGSLINHECGATSPSVVAKLSAERGCIGITFDGDGDRVLASDETGRVIDGDGIVAIIARALDGESRLPHRRVAVTVMSNLALKIWAAEYGIELVVSDVGDRALMDAMESSGAVIGAEQSGHIIVDGIGDGIGAALMLLSEVMSQGRPLSELIPFEPFPQKIVNVKTSNGFVSSDRVNAAVSKADLDLGQDGRLLVRPSGTEPVVRVMVEARDAATAERVASEVAQAVAEQDVCPPVVESK